MADNVLQDKVVLVTGAGRGIGAEIAKLAAAEGAKVVVNDIGGSVTGEGVDIGPAEQTVDAITEAGGKAIASTANVADYDAVKGMIDGAVDAFGRIDGVVNVAGILRDVIFHKMSVEDWHAVIDVHLNGSFYIARAAAQHFRAQESGAMVHFTSNSGLIGNIGQVNYGAAKMGIVGMSRNIALDMQRFNVRSNIISPSAFTRMIETIPTKTPETVARVERQKQMTPQKIAPMVVYLLSDLAKDVSGQVFYVRRNEIFLMSQPRPVRSVQRGDGWTPKLIHEHAMPAFRSSLVPLERSADVFTWDPV